MTRLQAARKIPVTVTMMSKTTRWAAPLALTRVLLVGLCVCWPSYTSAESTQRDPSQDQTQTQDAVEAIRLAAEQGDAVAQVTLGVMYGSGEGVPQDETEAVRWYRLAADQGDADAQYNLGVVYAFGAGVSQDDVAAHMWFNLAGARSSGEERDTIVELRDAVAERMTSEQITEAQRRAREWNPTVEP